MHNVVLSMVRLEGGDSRPTGENTTRTIDRTDGFEKYPGQKGSRWGIALFAPLVNYFFSWFFDNGQNKNFKFAKEVIELIEKKFHQIFLCEKSAYFLKKRVIFTRACAFLGFWRRFLKVIELIEKKVLFCRKAWFSYGLMLKFQKSDRNFKKW